MVYVYEHFTGRYAVMWLLTLAIDSDGTIWLDDRKFVTSIRGLRSEVCYKSAIHDVYTCQTAGSLSAPGTYNCLTGSYCTTSDTKDKLTFDGDGTAVFRT